MVIGIDHVALSTLNIDRGKEILSNWGYRIQFFAKDLLNSQAKKEYVAQMNEYHDMAYCNSIKPSLSIELIKHGDRFLEEENSPYKVVFSGKNPASELDFNRAVEGKMEIFYLIFGKKIKPIWLPDFKTSAYYLEDSEESKSEGTFIKCIILFCRDLQRTAAFWKDVGFSVVNKEEKYVLLEFKSIFPNLCINMALIESRDKKTDQIYKIDYPGFNCIAILVKDVEKEKKRLMGLGYKVGEIFDFVVGNNLLKICLFAGFNGECAELIQLIKKIS